MIVPFQRAGIPIKLYRLRPDLRPDLDHLQKTICKGALVVIIHYFGFLTETGALREIVSNANGILFEDCAHALFAKAPDADVALWSFNKFLPVVDGAILRSRRRDIDLSLHNLIQPHLPARVMGAYHQHLDLNARLALAPTEQAADLLNESMMAYEQYYQAISTDLAVYSQSDETAAVVANTDLGAIKIFRGHNAASYYRLTPECFRFRDHVPVSPFAFPVVIRPPANCEDVYDRLMKIGVLASRLIDKWDHIPKGDDRFGVEHTFMDQHLLLPVGEEVTYNHVRRVGTVLKEAAGADSAK